MTTQQTEANQFWDERYSTSAPPDAAPATAGDPSDYTQHPFLYQRSIARPQTGSLDGFNLDRIGNLYLTPPPALMLSLGCGMAFVEELLLRKNYAQRIVAYEMSVTATQSAGERLAAAGLSDRIEFRNSDVLTDGLADAQFDVVFVQAAIHHFMNIEAMYELMHRVLKPGGLLVFDEYVGPDHHIYPPEILAIMNEINDCLAPQYRYDTVHKQTRTNIPPPSLDWILAYDPSEGVHASQILPLTYRWFDVLDRRDYGGTILRGFFVSILANFDFTDPKDQTVASIIILIEQLLTRHAIIPHYQTGIVARRREQPLAPFTAAQQARINYDGWQVPAPAIVEPGVLSTIRSALRALRG